MHGRGPAGVQDRQRHDRRADRQHQRREQGAPSQVRRDAFDVLRPAGTPGDRHELGRRRAGRGRPEQAGEQGQRHRRRRGAEDGRAGRAADQQAVEEADDALDADADGAEQGPGRHAGARDRGQVEPAEDIARPQPGLRLLAHQSAREEEELGDQVDPGRRRDPLRQPPLRRVRRDPWGERPVALVRAARLRRVPAQITTNRSALPKSWAR